MENRRNMFAQIHTLTPCAGVLLNRDDVGVAKALTYGGVPRLRVSSQSLKRHWRVFDGPGSLDSIEGAAKSARSRDTVNKLVMKGVEGDEDTLSAIAEAFNVGVYGKEGGKAENRQILLLGYPEVEYLRERAREIAAMPDVDAKSAADAIFSNSPKNPLRANMQAFREQTLMPGGLTAAMFGRMATSDPRANIDAPIHVAHSFTTHQGETEPEYFVAVDDLPGEGEAMVSHIGSTEITSGLYYGCVAADVAGLASNATGCDRWDWRSEDVDRGLAAQAASRLPRIIATVSPGAKRGSTAPYAYAELMLVELGESQPRTLAGAFKTPAEMSEAAQRLASHLETLDENCEIGEERRFFSSTPASPPNSTRCNLAGLQEWLATSIVQAK